MFFRGFASDFATLNACSVRYLRNSSYNSVSSERFSVILKCIQWLLKAQKQHRSSTERYHRLDQRSSSLLQLMYVNPVRLSRNIRVLRGRVEVPVVSSGLGIAVVLYGIV